MSIFRSIYHVSALLAFALLTSGCSSIHHKPLRASAPGPHKIAIFFDGTANDVASDTNIKRLHSLVSLQGKRNISSIYIEGVGVDKKFIGGATGLGLKRRVLIAYEFILNNYRSDDEIYIFGFSRGAYAARILTSMLYNAGIVTGTDESVSEVADMVFNEFKYPLDKEIENQRKEKIKAALSDRGLTVEGPISVDVLGLWDTVEAMGVANWTSRILHKLGIRQHIADIDGPNTRYGDRLCNVKRAYQALSIDDNREWIFTPLPLSRTYLFKGCALDNKHLLDTQGNIIPKRFREVWFSGAHSDVGGGYPDSLMSGVSLNWMIENLKDTRLLPANAKVPSDAFGTSHNPEAGFWGLLYHDINRDIATYVTDEKRHRKEFRNTLCVHPTVLERRRTAHLNDHEYENLSLLKIGSVIVVPDKTRHGWAPRLIEVTESDPTAATSKQVKVQVWPDCQGMMQ